ncbi:MAG: hypothetical protein IKE94_02305 [Aeriscardovia sp.]|nr:hypothetical protein [Aeriscardovia sp.]MBR3463041.1 hypothetical protein [Clostridiales bacterium]
MSGKRNNPHTGKDARKKEAARKAAAKAKQENKKLNTPAVTDVAKEQVVKEPDTVVISKANAISKVEPAVKTKPAKEKRVKKYADAEPPYTPDCIDDSEIPLITEQIHDLRSEYISIQSNFLTVTSIAFVGFGVVLYYAFYLENNSADTENFINFVFIALPFLFGISFLNILKYTVRMMGIGAYVSHLEKLLNAKTQKNLFLWHKKMVGINGYTIVGLAQLPCYFALFAVVTMKYLENMELLKVSDIELLGFTAAKLHFLIKLSMYVMLAIGGYSIFVSATQHKAVAYWSKNIFKLPYDKKINTHVPFWIHALLVFIKEIFK